MAPPSEEVRAVLGELGAAPARLAALLNAAPDPALDRPPPAGGWTVREIVAHLADLEFNLHWTGCVARILCEDAPRLASAEPEWRALEHGHRYQHVRVALGVFTVARKHLVRELEALGPEGWERIGVDPEDGPRTLLEVARGFARHDRRHMARMAEMLALASADPDG